MTDLAAKAEEILDEFIFGNIWNHRNPDEDNWDITFEGENFLLRHRPTGELINVKVTFSGGDLSEEDMQRLGDEQEWFE